MNVLRVETTWRTEGVTTSLGFEGGPTGPVHPALTFRMPAVCHEPTLAVLEGAHLAGMSRRKRVLVGDLCGEG